MNKDSNNKNSAMVVVTNKKIVTRFHTYSLALVCLCFLILSPKQTNAQQACVASPGNYCPTSDGATAVCPMGHYCTGTTNSFTACPAGTFLGATGSSSLEECQACGPNMVAPNTGMSACRSCNSGSIYGAPNACITCAAGTRSVSGDASCTPCEAGTAAAVGSETCSLCRPGSYSASGFAAACTACPSGTFTYMITQATSSSGAPLYTPVWGASSSLQCVAVPSATPQTPLVCLPGTRMQGAGCVPCPIGYFCPLISVSEGDAVQACPDGSMSVSPGAITASDCTVASALVPFDFEQCSITPGRGITLLDGLSIRAMAASSDAKTIFFATATAVYRMYLQTNTVELLVGEEGVGGPVISSVSGAAARFTDITALGVDLDRSDATVVVVGDGAAIRVINVYTRQVTRLGAVGDVSRAGGIALRRDGVAGGTRWAYVSDANKHRIQAFNLETLQRVHVAGDIIAGGGAGYTDGYYTGARFKNPMGLSFLERSMEAGRVLLIADSGNGVIRALDTTTRVVTTWFAPLDSGSRRELNTPVGLSVSIQGGTTLVYVADIGKKEIMVIQQPSGGVKVATKVRAPMASYTAVVPYGSLLTSSATIVGYNQLLTFDSMSHQLGALVQDMLANTAEGGGSVPNCHLPCQIMGCGPLSTSDLCGNSFLDAGEQCDMASGCYANNCTLKEGYTCPLLLQQGIPPSSCMAPCLSYLYEPTGTRYCASDCAALTPRLGYTIDSQCVENDIDECAANTDTCDASAGMCINTPGSYRCQCFSGYFGDGVTCVPNAYAVYTVVDIPSLPASAVSGGDSVTTSVMNGVEAAYAAALSTAIPSNMMSTSGFPSLLSAAELAALYTSYSVDPVRPLAARIELVSLFETAALASEVAGSIAPSQLSEAISMAFFGVSTGASVFQRPMMRPHRPANGVGGNTAFVDGWGMNVTGVTYNRTCVVSGGGGGGGGCWQVEMIYMGGKALPNSNDEGGLNQNYHQSKNVLYLPRIDRNADTMEPLIPAQVLTMSSGSYFPCDVSAVSAAGQGLAPPATACCIRNVAAGYRAHVGLNEFLQSEAYAQGVPLDACSAGILNDTYPGSDVVFQLPNSANNDATNDLVVGQIDGMPHSEVRLLETIDYTTRTFRVLLVLEEGDLREHASMVEGITGLSYNMTFFVGLANFKGTGGAVMNTKNAQQFVTVTKSNSLTVSTFGSTKDPLVNSVDMQLVRVKVTDFFNPVQYLYYLKPVFTMPSNFRKPVVLFFIFVLLLVSQANF